MTSPNTTEPIELLRHFSVAANKSAAGTHPMDRKRWLAFVAATVHQGRILDPDRVRDLLKQMEWPEPAATKLAQRYEDEAEAMQAYAHFYGHGTA